jgi:hypothetical protein
MPDPKDDHAKTYVGEGGKFVTEEQGQERPATEEEAEQKIKEWEDIQKKVDEETKK